MILSREGAQPQVSKFFFKVVVQSVLFFSEETWVVAPLIGRFLGGFQYQEARRLTGQLPQRALDGELACTLEEAARVEARFEPMETYI